MRSMNDQPRVHIASVIRNAVIFNPKNWNGVAVDADTLFEAVERLFSLLRERRVDYVLVGGIAMLQYVEGRNTEDIDLIMALSSAKGLPEIEITSADQDFARGKLDGLQIDLLLTSNPLFEYVRRHHATSRSFVEQEIPCATVEGLILLKLYALPSLYRQGNFGRVGLYENDVATLIHEYRPDLAGLLEQLSHHVSESDLVAVRDIVAEIQQRIERFDRS